MARRTAGEPDKPATASERTRTEIAALLAERSGYIAPASCPTGVAQVDDQIRARGGKPPA